MAVKVGLFPCARPCLQEFELMTIIRASTLVQKASQTAPNLSSQYSSHAVPGRSRGHTLDDDCWKAVLLIVQALLVWIRELRSRERFRPLHRHVGVSRSLLLSADSSSGGGRARVLPGSRRAALSPPSFPAHAMARSQIHDGEQCTPTDSLGVATPLNG